MTTKEKFTAQVSLPSDTEVRVTRDFNAPRTLVWQAHTDPKLVRRWMLGYPGWSMPVCEMDVRVGGTVSLALAPGRERRRSSASSARSTKSTSPRSSSYDQYYDPGTASAAPWTDTSPP